LALLRPETKRWCMFQIIKNDLKLRNYENLERSFTKTHINIVAKLDDTGVYALFL